MNELRIAVLPEDLAALEHCTKEGACEHLKDDGADYSRRVVDKPWGFEYQVSLSAEQSVWKLHLKPGGETSMHCHPNKETVLIVSDGTIEFSTLTKSHTLTVGAIVRIQKGAFHRSASSMGAILIEIESPPNKRDLVRALDKYGREGKGY